MGAGAGESWRRRLPRPARGVFGRLPASSWAGRRVCPTRPRRSLRAILATGEDAVCRAGATRAEAAR
eukprot:11208347-Lingulodinium_polyedra.AAC.1